MIIRTLAALVLALGLITAACGDDDEDVTPTDGTPSPAATVTPAGTPTPTPDPRPPTDAAIDALAIWLGPVGDPASITVSSVEAVTWPDGCLGLSRVGQACTEALVDGFRIELALGDGVYEVRTDLTGDVVLWAPSVQILAQFKEAGTNLIQFTTDDGGTIEAQPVFGTGFGVDPDTLAEGDPVGIALADAPQSGPQLLVWLDPASE